ncbi:MAG: flagellar type III secretion system protein FlhB [Gemmobacter sp.]|nr:flagellar type III secretion system protein FlhB [Gemmobacter sp.]
MSEDDAEKEHEASEQKLEDARKRGEVAQGRDLYAAAAFAGLLVAALSMGLDGIKRIGAAGAVLLDQADRLAAELTSGPPAIMGGLGIGVITAVAPLFVVPMIAVILMIVAQRAFVVAPEKLMPKLSRISPLQGAKTKFGRAGLFEFAKSSVKLIVVSIVMGLFLMSHIEPIIATLHLSPGAASAVLFQYLLEFLAIILVMQAVMGVVDLIWQRQDHLRKNKMSRKELMDEFKNSDGDPHVKAQRKQRGREIAMNKMMADVPTADVVVVNPTHYAVALKWNRAGRGAPICVAKGVDGVAARIREAASGAGVPIRHDPPTARALFAAVEIGQEIRPDHYRAVAAAIRFAEAMRLRARERGGT